MVVGTIDVVSLGLGLGLELDEGAMLTLTSSSRVYAVEKGAYVESKVREGREGQN